MAGPTAEAPQWEWSGVADVHFGANRGRRLVVILLATLFTSGSPASIPVT